MAAGRIVIPNWMPALDSDGEPIPGARMFFYQNETTTLQAIYANENLTATLPNPLSANGSGRFQDVWADTSLTYSVVVDAPYGPPGAPFTYDNVVAGSNGGGGGSVDPAEVALIADERISLVSGKDITPEGAIANPVSLADGYAVMQNDLISRWWDPINNRIGGDRGGWQDGQLTHQWKMWNLSYSLAEKALAGDADARTKVIQNFQELVARKGAAVLGQATLANDIGASDDSAWHLQGLMMTRRVALAAGNTSVASQALSIASALLASTRSIFADPANKNAGILYTTDDLANGTNVGGQNPNLIRLNHYRVSSTHELFIAIAALDIDEAQGVTTRRSYAKGVYDWVKQYAVHPLGVILTEVDLDPAHPGTPKPLNDGSPIKPHFPFTSIAMTFAFMTLCKRLNDVLPDPQYLADINATMAAVLRDDTFLRPGPLFLPDRDGWTNGMGFPRFVDEVLPLSGLDEENVAKVKQTLHNTALSIIRQRTDTYYRNRETTYGAGFYGADWTPPELGTNGQMSWFQTSNSTNPDIAAPEQIATTGSSAAVVTAAAKLTGIQGTDQLVTWSQLGPILQKIAETYAPFVGDVSFRDAVNVGGDLRRERDFFMGMDEDGSFVAFDNQDYVKFFRTANRWSFRINGNGRFDIDDGGTSTYGGHTVAGDLFVRVDGKERLKTDRGGAVLGGGLTTQNAIYSSGDFNFFMGKSSSGWNAIGFGNGTYEHYNPDAKRFERVIDNQVVATLGLTGGWQAGAPSGYVLPDKNLNSVAVSDINQSDTALSVTGPARQFTVLGINTTANIRVRREFQGSSGNITQNQTNVRLNGVVQGGPLGTVAGAQRTFGVVNNDVVSFEPLVTSSSGQASVSYYIVVENVDTLVEIVRFKVDRTVGAPA